MSLGDLVIYGLVILLLGLIFVGLSLPVVKGRRIVILYYENGKCCMIKKPTPAYQCWNSTFFDCVEQVGRMWVIGGGINISWGESS